MSRTTTKSVPLLALLCVCACTEPRRIPPDTPFTPDASINKDAATDVPDLGTTEDTGVEDDAGSAADADLEPDAKPPPPDAGQEPISFRVMTFNTGTGANPPFNQMGYTNAMASISDQFYGNGLAWVEAIDDLRTFIANTDVDVVVFQEIFHPEDCANIPISARIGFVCETWSPGGPTVAQMVLGPGWQVACHFGKNDKCAAVRRRFGTFVGCNGSLCLDGLAGTPIAGCGDGSRVGSGVIRLTSGSTLTVVNVHGTSGLSRADRDCREEQFEQVFEELVDRIHLSSPHVDNIVLGDFNTDPGRNTSFDSSARRLNDFVGGDYAFQYISEVGANAPPSYSGLFNIDHVISDQFVGECWTAGVTPNHPDVTDIVIFDHKPLVCDLTTRSAL